LNTGFTEASGNPEAHHGIEHAQPGGKHARFLKGFAVFLILGPPIGSWTYMICFDLVIRPTNISVARLIGMSILGMPASYVIGIVPAALAGLLVASLQVMYRWFGGTAAFLVGVGVGLLFSALFDTRPDQHLSPAWGYPAVKILTCVVPTLVCWAVIRRWRTIDAPQAT